MKKRKIYTKTTLYLDQAARLMCCEMCFLFGKIKKNENVIYLWYQDYLKNKLLKKAQEQFKSCVTFIIQT